MERIPFDADNIFDTVAALRILRKRPEAEPVHIFIALTDCDDLKEANASDEPAIKKTEAHHPSPAITCSQKMKSIFGKTKKNNLFGFRPFGAWRTWQLSPQKQNLRNKSKDSRPVLIAMVSLAGQQF